jgi:hypothetical protein
MMGVNCHTPMDWSAELVINTELVVSGCQQGLEWDKPARGSAWSVYTPQKIPQRLWPAPLAH